MTINTNEPTYRKPLRLWPGVVLAIVLVIARYVAPLLAPDAEVFQAPLALIGVLAGMACAVAIVVWWLLFSRAPWSERLGAIALMIVALFATRTIVHESVRGGMMGNMLLFYGIPIMSLALVIWAVVTRRFGDSARRALMVVAILLASGIFTLIRTDGVMGAGAQFAWRWTPTAEQRLLAQAHDEPKPLPLPPAASESPAQPLDSAAVERPVVKADASPTAPSVAAKATTETPKPVAPPVARRAADWPGFRGADRDSVIRGVRIATDWSTSPPVELWRRAIGPGWSSFAVDGDLLYTQEQRGEDEVVGAYNVKTGEPVWRHRDPARFYESNGGAGPRGTPTLANNRVYALGATGILNALDAATGKVVWTRNAATEASVEVPGWGFTSSPLVIDDIVIVGLSGRLVGFDADTGERRWLGPEGGSGYSSPHLLIIDNVPQVLLLRGSRTISVSPADGSLLWEHVWQVGVGIVQPAMAGERDVLITTGDAMGGLGIRRVSVAKGSSGWNVEERWTTRGLKPYFNDLVVHKGYAFGFDGSILACIDLADGTRKWKGGRYGNGQLVLLPEQDLLLVLSEEGELALVGATPDGFRELARIPGIEGKTWNHPVVVGDVLLARNGQEMAAFRLPHAGR